MPTVALVRLRHGVKEYWFDPNGVGAQEGDHVLVETSRGQEIGMCVEGEFEVEQQDIENPLKPILRLATDEDLEKCDELAKKDDEAMSVFKELAAKHELDMKPVAVEFMFDESHATFFFTADERVDFRSLVRDLASQFHVRVDMRQIGVRDESRMLGGYGHCGEELCCARMGGEFQPVSIRMAKEQDLPLNPVKISGLCGRLMCCLRYEFEAYKDFKSRAPKKNGLIETPQGVAKVVEFDTPRETVRVRFEDGKSMVLPVASLDTGGKVARNGENIRPCHISSEKFDEIIEELNNDTTFAMMGERAFSSDPQLADRESDGNVKRGGTSRRDRSSSRGKSDSRRRESGRREQEGRNRDQRRRRRRVSAVATESAQESSTTSGSVVKIYEDTPEADQSKRRNESRKNSRRRRRRSSNSRSGQGDSGSKQQSSRSASQGEPSNGRRKERSSRPGSSRPRPGQHSSSVSGDAPASQERSDQGQPRKRRRRRSGSRGGQSRQGGQNRQGGQGKQGPSANQKSGD